MKYIRTKDGIYEVKLEDVKFRDKLYYIVCERKSKDENIKGLIDINQVIKQSDTIEELCDEFRYKYDEFLQHERCWRNSKGMWLDNDNDLPLSEKEISTIKGAIWTESGLKYVAKMNEEGDLELI